MHVIQAILGHAQVSTTSIYTDPTNALTREAADKMGRALWPDADETVSEQIIADELRKALAASDQERIRQALQAAQEWPRLMPQTPRILGNRNQKRNSRRRPTAADLA